MKEGKREAKEERKRRGHFEAFGKVVALVNEAVQNDEGRKSHFWLLRRLEIGRRRRGGSKMLRKKVGECPRLDCIGDCLFFHKG